MSDPGGKTGKINGIWATTKIHMLVIFDYEHVRIGDRPSPTSARAAPCSDRIVCRSRARALARSGMFGPLTYGGMIRLVCRQRASPRRETPIREELGTPPEAVELENARVDDVVKHVRSPQVT